MPHKPQTCAAFFIPAASRITPMKMVCTLAQKLAYIVPTRENSAFHIGDVAFVSLILYLDYDRAAIAYVCQSGEESAPVNISQARELRRMVF